MICVYCDNQSKGGIDHFVPRSRGGTDRPENLVPCCIACNKWKHAKSFYSVEQCRAMRQLKLQGYKEGKPKWRYMQFTLPKNQWLKLKLYVIENNTNVSAFIRKSLLREIGLTEKGE